MSEFFPLEFVRVYVLRCSKAKMMRITGCDKKTYYNWENLTSNPSWLHLKKLRDYMVAEKIPFESDWFFMPPRTFIEAEKAHGRECED